MYEVFRKMSKIPFIDITTFCHIVPFIRISCKSLYSEFCQKQKMMNFYEFLCAMVLTSYANTENKYRCTKIIISSFSYF